MVELIKRDSKGRFIKGSISWNKGIVNYYHSGSFKIGHKINLGKKCPEERKERISKKLKGREIFWANKIAKSNKGKHSSPDTEFKEGERHRFWEGSLKSWNRFYHHQARILLKNLGYKIEGLEVHHINKDFSDNNLENLKILSKTEHTKLHMFERFGVENDNKKNQ